MPNSVSDQAAEESSSRKASGWTARIEPARDYGVVYVHETGVETTDTEFVEQRTRQAAAGGGR